VLIPDHETAVDFLNYEAVAHTVVRLLRDNRQRALTFGIHGDWGAGKSSVLKMVQAAMKDDDDVACLWFNGWAFQGFDDTKTVLIEVIITELLRQRKGIEKVKELGGRLLKRIDTLKLARRAGGLAFNVITGLPSPDQITTAFESIQALAGSVKSMSPADIEGKLTELGGFLKPAEERSIPEQIHHFREEFKELLEAAKIKQLIVLIDDLDRCLPATAIDTLEAIRLFLFVDKTAFIIGADEGMIEYAVREHFPNLPLATGPVPYARNYLEKLIQVPFRIPALGVQESRAYVTLLLVQALVGEDHGGFKTLLAKARESLNRPWLGATISQGDVRAVDKERRDDLDAAFVVAQQIGPILAEGTKGNPRQIKRFLNALYIRMTIAGERGFGDIMNPAVLGKLMLAERFQPDFYEYLATEAMHANNGEVAALRVIETPTVGDSKAKERKASKAERTAAPSDDDVAKWAGRDWVAAWLRIEPSLAGIDLRPYVFVAREKRIVGRRRRSRRSPRYSDRDARRYVRDGRPRRRATAQGAHAARCRTARRGASRPGAAPGELHGDAARFFRADAHGQISPALPVRSARPASWHRAEGARHMGGQRLDGNPHRPRRAGTIADTPEPMGRAG
jgi:predicted KAP-like P-loop ATPase